MSGHSTVRRPVKRCHFIVSVLLAVAIGAAAMTPPASAQATEEEGPPDYVLGVEDRLSILVWKENDLNRTVAIRPDGKITVPLVGEIQAAGKTPKQLTDDLAKALAKFIKEPVVAVIVEEINNFKVSVLGEIAKQGVLVLKRRTRLLEAIALSGGVTPFADKSNVVIVRDEDGHEVRSRIDYRKILNGEHPEYNIWLKPGDVLIVN